VCHLLVLQYLNLLFRVHNKPCSLFTDIQLRFADIDDVGIFENAGQSRDMRFSSSSTVKTTPVRTPGKGNSMGLLVDGHCGISFGRIFTFSPWNITRFLPNIPRSYLLPSYHHSVDWSVRVDLIPPAPVPSQGWMVLPLVIARSLLPHWTPANNRPQR
jgi:hypothetical protein